ncbi:MAG: GNAT family N-acetyltransferase [Candidatus Omnitrophota bacterium]|jgi:N-acetylglutamate synthase-like GNAT family acetyltransferase
MSEIPAIRKATIADIDSAIDLLKEFQEESLAEYGIRIELNFAKEFVKTYVANSLVIEAEGKIVGVVSGIITDYPLDGSKIYQEAVWYVSKAYRKYGIKLLKHLEDKCRAEGIRHLVMVHLGNDIGEKIERFYLHNNFKYLEKHYIKTL